MPLFCSMSVLRRRLASSDLGTLFGSFFPYFSLDVKVTKDQENKKAWAAGLNRARRSFRASAQYFDQKQHLNLQSITLINS